MSEVALALSWSLVRGGPPYLCVDKKVCMGSRVNSPSRQVVALYDLDGESHVIAPIRGRLNYDNEWMNESESGFVGQAVRRSPQTARDPSSRHGHSIGFRGGYFFLRFLPFFSTTNFISFISFLPPLWSYFRHSCYSQTFNEGASSHLIPRPGPVTDTSSGYYESEPTSKNAPKY